MDVDAIVTGFLGAVSGSAVVGFLAKWFFHRAVTKWMDDMEAQQKAGVAALAALEKENQALRAWVQERFYVTDKSFAAVSERLSVGAQAFELDREARKELAARVKELEARERERGRRT